MSEYFFIIGNRDAGPLEVYAAVVASNETLAVEKLRARIDDMVGDGNGVDIATDDEELTLLQVAINTRQISVEDIVTKDAEHSLEWDGEEIREAQGTSSDSCAEEDEVAEKEMLTGLDQFKVIVKDRQSKWEVQNRRGLRFQVAEKGGVSVYGLGRYPTTLYYEQWVKLLDSSDALRKFLEENKQKLKRKPS